MMLSSNKLFDEDRQIRLNNEYILESQEIVAHNLIIQLKTDIYNEETGFPLDKILNDRTIDPKIYITGYLNKLLYEFGILFSNYTISLDNERKLELKIFLITEEGELDVFIQFK